MRQLLCVFFSILFSSLAVSADFNTLHHFAQLANISYEQGDHTASLQKLNHKLLKQQVLPGIEVNYFLSTYKGTQYLTVRGTANVQNAIVDLDIKLIDNPHLGIVAHQGFANAAQQLFKDVQPLLNKQMPMVTTGHSLGGAVAVVLAMELRQAGFMLQNVITFGQPKVTNVGGAKTFADLPLTRVVTPKDIVPLVPPLSPIQIKNLDIYWHMGKEVVLLQGAQYSVIEGLKSMMRATEFTSALPNEENLNAHKMQTYIELINHKRKASEEVPYETSFKLFGFGS